MTISDDGTILLGARGTNPDDVPAAELIFYDSNGDPFSEHLSLNEALQASEDASRAMAAADGSNNEYGAATILGRITEDGTQTFYNSLPVTSERAHAIRFNVRGLEGNLVAVNHLHPTSGHGFSPADR